MQATLSGKTALIADASSGLVKAMAPVLSRASAVAALRSRFDFGFLD